ncbi:ATP-binding cassette sub-family C member 10-like [Ylistrum balloti]|uniref:ATP-binding cassette sub-family C member 10-like n=1 Tax=Ylistrum balloti TaxID=509963 RepID=UPI002905B770|nr:ATP-binding cassette sub-family C member 10-like [Ylistrum balloti]
MFSLPRSLNVKKVQERFLEILQGNTTHPDGRRRISLLKALHKAYGVDFYIRCGIVDLIDKLIRFTYPISLWRLISYLENKNEPSHFEFGYVLALGLSGFAVMLVDSIYEYMTMHIYFKIRISVMTAIYQKVLTVNTVSLSQFTSGEIVNFLGADTQKLVYFCILFNKAWIIPIETAIGMYILYQLVGIAFLGGLITNLLLVAIMKIISAKQRTLAKLRLELKDKRMELINEVLCGIKNIKCYTWEEHFRALISKVRDEELQTLKQKKILDAVTECLSTIAPAALTILTFGIYTVMGNTLTATKMFTTLTVFSKLTGSLNRLPTVFSAIIEAAVSLERIEKFIALPNIDSEIYYEPIQEYSSKNVISVNDGKFGWGRKKCNTSMEKGIRNFKSEKTSRLDSLTLQNITVDIVRGQFIGVIGKVGAGKSSFLHAVLAEMAREHGSISVSNLQQGFALASQEPWIQHSTIRDNVLFGNPFNGKKYAEILRAVSLQKDMKMFQTGDKTEVGENGVTLSGGQKARLALARAVYQEKDVYLLDDPLAAVDSHVARHIYDKCIMGLLKNKTRILCTHHIKFLEKADLIIVMDGGVISKAGVPSEILDNTVSLEQHPSSEQSEAGYIEVADNDPDGNLGEDRATEEIRSRVYKVFLTALGKWLPIAVLLTIVFREALGKLKDWFLIYWTSGLSIPGSITSDPGYLCFHDNMSSPTSLDRVFGMTDAGGSVMYNQSSLVYNIMVYGFLGILYSLSSFANAILVMNGGLRLAKIMHNQLLDTVFKAPMSFFNVTPIGRILNLFSSDMTTIDDTLSRLISVVLCKLFGVVGILSISTYGMPWFLLVLIPVAAAYYQIEEKYRHTSREVRRIVTLKHTPIFSHLSETISGVVTIRAFRDTERFKDKHIHRMNKWLEARYTAHNIGNWLWVQTLMVVNVMVTGIATLAVLEHNIHGIDPSIVGLAISFILSLSDLLDEFVCFAAEAQKQMLSLERVQQYVENSPSERWDGKTPPPTWPALGVVSYSDVYMKYRDDLPDVLKGVTFRTRHAEKVGIVGRTGSGKSSLFQTLFRTVEINSGDITVDEVNILQLNLKDIRRHLTVIPQDPFLFSGNVRENLDPTSCYSDDELWRIIDKCHLRHPVDRLGGLEGDVAEKGRNFSVGQRQLMCLARALLTKAKVLCIDEATASVDLDTDKLIQETIRQEFMDSTVLTIAHRINTIMDSDRVLVMDQGRVVELDSPGNLLKDTKSAFYQLVHGETYNIQNNNRRY